MSIFLICFLATECKRSTASQYFLGRCKIVTMKNIYTLVVVLILGTVTIEIWSLPCHFSRDFGYLLMSSFSCRNVRSSPGNAVYHNVPVLVGVLVLLVHPPLSSTRCPHCTANPCRQRPCYYWGHWYHATH